jgi:hypothetical protein
MAKPDQLVRPCAKCPFRTDVKPYLTKARVREIERSVVHRQSDFPCHQTTTAVEDDNGESEMMVTSKSKRCAGMTILCEKIGHSTQMMRIDERLGFYNPELNDKSAPVFASFRAMEKAQQR